MIRDVDIVFGLSWGDEGKGKVASQLASTGNYDIVARWAGGNNAGHTVYVNGEKYKTHLIPSGVFFGIKSVIGPACVLHLESFFEEMQYLEDNGFDAINLVKVSPRCHIITEDHVQIDKERLAGKLGTTAKGIGPCYASKAGRTGIMARDISPLKDFIWDEDLSGRVLCEGAQGFYLDMDQGNYPYVTSSTTLPYGACSLGFPPQRIRNVWGICKTYDTRSGVDPLFPESLFDNPQLEKIANLGAEYGVTTGRRRKVNFLNLDMLINAINISGTNRLVINKCDILQDAGIFRLFDGSKTPKTFVTWQGMKTYIENSIALYCPLVETIDFSCTPETI